MLSIVIIAVCGFFVAILAGNDCSRRRACEAQGGVYVQDRGCNGGCAAPQPPAPERTR